MRSLGLLFGLVLLAACDSTRPPSAPPPPPAPAATALRDLAVFVANPEILGATNDPNYSDVLRSALEARLRQEGYKLVDVATPHDVTARIVAQQNADHAAVWNYTLKLDSGDESVDQTSSEWADSDAVTIARLVDPLARSERLVAFARRVRPTVDQAAAAGPAPGPSPAAPVEPIAPTSASATFISAAPQRTAYAVVIGVEKYSHSLPPPTGARSDAEHFASVARTSLGLPADHVKVALDGDATKGTVESMIAWARDSVPPSGRIYFYFSGHGAPDASAGTPYLVPADGDPQFLTQSAIPETEIVAELSKGKAREVIVLLDSCFSGAGGRSVLPPGARPLVRVKEAPATGNIAVLTASSGAEISGPSTEGTGGVFTKYVVQGLGTGAADMDGDGQITLQELSDWVRPRVSREAKAASRDQNPGLIVSSALGPATGVAVEWGLPTK